MAPGELPIVPAPSGAEQGAPLRVVIVDDEPLARLRLRTLCAELVSPRCEVVAEAGDAFEAAECLRALGTDGAAGEAPDALLLDIRLPGRSGLQIASALRALPLPPAVIFVTAHAEHAVAAFELEATDYLTKPVRRERLAAALARVAARRMPAGAEAAVAPVLAFTDRGRVQRVPVADLLWVRAEAKHLTLRTARHHHVMDGSLADVAVRAGEALIRVHRNALVARGAVRELAGREGGRWAVRVAPTDEWLEVSRRLLPAVREALAAQG
jgi:two-component system response regulator AlgR